MSIDVAIRHVAISDHRRFELDVAFATDKRRLVIYGPSGAGKTLTLRAVAGLLRPDHGRIVVNGRTLFDSDQGIDTPAHDRRCGYLFQDYALFPHLTVAQNIRFGLKAGLRNPSRSGMDEASARWIKALELEAVVRSYPSQLSGGQRQRTALARALAAGPDILLLDEPFSAIDPALRGRLRQELAELQSTLDLPMIVITHDPADADALGDEVLEIRDGRIHLADPGG